MELLAIYLRDHLAGSTFGLELVKRVCAENRDNEFTPALTQLRDQIAADRATLVDVMDRLAVARNPLKEQAGWLAEKVGRLKLNGQLSGYSPLSRLLELETLEMGIVSKRSMWRALAAAHGEDARLRGIELDALIARADAQLSAVEALRTRAALIALR